MRTDLKRMTSKMISIFLICVILFSFFYVVKEAHHECKGEDCPICASIQEAVHNLTQMATGVLLGITIVFYEKKAQSEKHTFHYLSTVTTLVSSKVRLNN